MTQQRLKLKKIRLDLIPKMQGQHEIKANILIEIENTVMHRLVSKQKSLFTSGVCKVAKIDNPNQNTVYFINLNSFYYTLNKSVVFVSLEYDDTVSYLFPHFDNGLSAITLIKKAQTIHNFQQIISNAATLTTFEQSQKNAQLKSKIDQHCPGIQKQPLQVADKIKSTIRQTGKLLGYGFKAIGQFLAGGVQTVGEYIGNKVEEPQEKGQVAPETKQKWESLKKGTSSAFNISKELYGKYLSPIVAVGVDYGKQVVQKIETSDNSAVKYARQLASTSGEALNTAFQGLSQGTSKVGQELGSQSRKIVNKKYGQDYVHTFLPEGEKKQETTPLAQGTEQASPSNKTEETIKLLDNHEESKQQIYPQIGQKKQ